jgi:hypothetical protein
MQVVSSYNKCILPKLHDVSTVHSENCEKGDASDVGH